MNVRSLKRGCVARGPSRSGRAGLCSRISAALVVALAACMTEPPPPVARIAVSPVTATIGTGATVQLTAVPYGVDGKALSDRQVSWSTDNPAVATVSGAGLVSGAGIGSAKITATAEGKNAAAAIEVLPSVGPSGGTIQAAGGMVMLEFPPGALSQQITLNIQAAGTLSADLADLGVVGEAIFAFGPEGIQFAKPVRLTIAYRPTKIPSDVPATSLRLYQVVGTTLSEVEGSGVDVNLNTVSGFINGFSVYAIAIVLPFESEATNGFGAFNRVISDLTHQPNRMYHTGVDIPGARGTVVKAAASGSVVRVIGLAGGPGRRTDESIKLWDDKNEVASVVISKKPIPTGRSNTTNHGLGTTIIVEHTVAGRSAYTLYGHLEAVRKDIYEKVVQQSLHVPVTVDEPLGLMGSSQYSIVNGDFPPHLHLEFKDTPSLGNKGSDSVYWGYTPDSPLGYGYDDLLLHVYLPPTPSDADVVVKVVGEEPGSTETLSNRRLCTSAVPDRGVRVYAGPGVRYSVLGWTGRDQLFVADKTAI